MMAEVGSLSDDPSDNEEGDEEEGELSARPTACMEDFLFDPAGESCRRRVMHCWALTWTLSALLVCRSWLRYRLRTGIALAANWAAPPCCGVHCLLTDWRHTTCLLQTLSL